MVRQPGQFHGVPSSGESTPDLTRSNHEVPHASLDPSHILSIGVSLALVDAAGATSARVVSGRVHG